MHEEFNYFSFNKKSDWIKGKAFNLELADEGLKLCREERYGVLKVVRLPALEELKHEAADFVIGRNGLLYILDEEANLLSHDYRSGHTETVFRTGHDLFTGRAHITAHAEGLIAADPLSSKKIIAFSALNGQVLWSIDEYEGRSILPLAMSNELNGHIYAVVLQADPGAAEKDMAVPESCQILILKISMSGRIVNSYGNEAFRLGKGMKLRQLRNRISIAVSGDGGLAVLDSLDERLHLFDAGGGYANMDLRELPGKCSGLCMDLQNNVYIGDGRNIGVDAEDDRFVLKLDVRSGKARLAERLSCYRGRTDKLMTDRKGNLYIWDGIKSEITVLELKSKVKSFDLYREAGPVNGIYISRAIDSTLEELCWHKLLMDAEISEDTQIRVYYYTAEDKTVLINGMYCDLDEYIDGLGDGDAQAVRSLDPLWSQPVVNPRDALLHGSVGRYLWFKLEFIGSDERSPVLKKIRLYYPRQSYLSYLPGLYRENDESRDFLERFLSLFETFMSELEYNIDHFPRLLDIDLVSGELLNWMAGWLGVNYSDGWSEEQLRQLTKEALELYTKKGTRESLERLLEIYTGEKPIIVEYFQYKQLLTDTEYSGLMDRLYGRDPYRFSVLLKPGTVKSTQEYLMVQKIVNDHKPAFTEANIVQLQSWMYMDMHTYLGINTYLSELTVMQLDEKASIPHNTILIDVERDNRMDTHSRLGINIQLK